MTRPIEFPSPRGSTWINPDFVLTVTDLPEPGNYAADFHPERHCNVKLITGASVMLPYSSPRAIDGLFGTPGLVRLLPAYEPCCKYHAPDAFPVVGRLTSE